MYYICIHITGSQNIWTQIKERASETIITNSVYYKAEAACPPPHTAPSETTKSKNSTVKIQTGRGKY